MNDVVMNEEQIKFAIFLEHVAKTCHTANKLYCEELGDMSQPDWAVASDAVKEACYESVLYVLDYPDTTPEQLHMKWMQGKIKAGWIYGKKANVDTRIDPNLVSFNSLVQEEKNKDELFIMTVNSLRIANGLFEGKV